MNNGKHLHMENTTVHWASVLAKNARGRPEKAGISASTVGAPYFQLP